MKTNILVLAFLSLCFVTSCTDGVEKYDNWPEWKGRQIVLINGVSLDDAYYAAYLGHTFTLNQGDEVEFTGFSNLNSALQPAFWEVISETKARFLGAEGDYNLIFDESYQVLFTEPVDKNGYPTEIYLVGKNFGHPGAETIMTTTWDDGFKTPLNGIRCAATGNEDEFSVELFLGEGFEFKCYSSYSWGRRFEIVSASTDTKFKVLSPATPSLVMSNTSNQNFVQGALFQPGVYRLTMNLKTLTLTVEALGNTDLISMPCYINGEQMELNEGQDMFELDLSLKRGDEILFDGFGIPAADFISSDFFQVQSENLAIFKGLDGIYKLSYDFDTHLLFVRNVSMEYSDAAWIVGKGFGHVKAGKSLINAWEDDAFINPHWSYQFAKYSDDLLELSIYLDNDFTFDLFKKAAWGSINKLKPASGDTAGDSELVISNLDLILSKGTDYIPGPLFVPGIYYLTIDPQNKTLTVIPDDKSILKELKVNGTIMQTDTDWKLFNKTTVTDWRAKKAVVNLTEGESVTFEGFDDISKVLYPSLFTVTSGNTATFKGITGEYTLWYSLADKVINIKKTSYLDGTYTNQATSIYPEALIVVGSNFGHPKSTNLYNLYDGSFGDPRTSFQCIRVGDNTYETTLYLGSGCKDVAFWKKNSWGGTSGNVIGYGNTLTISASDPVLQLSGYTLKAATNFTPGIYRIRIKVDGSKGDIQAIEKI